MANRIDSMLAGAGPVRSVLGALTDAFPTDATMNATLANVTNSLERAWPDPPRRGAVLALVAAFLNQDFLETGQLWRVNPSGTLAYEYISGDNSRKVIASLIAD